MPHYKNPPLIEGSIHYLISADHQPTKNLSLKLFKIGLSVDATNDYMHLFEFSSAFDMNEVAFKLQEVWLDSFRSIEYNTNLFQPLVFSYYMRRSPHSNPICVADYQLISNPDGSVSLGRFFFDHLLRDYCLGKVSELPKRY